MYQTNIISEARKDMASEASIRIKSITIINMSKVSNRYKIRAYIKYPQCAIKKWASTDRPIECHVCLNLSSSLTL